MIARGASEGFPRSILCAVDGSESSSEIAALAAELAAAAEAELRLIHVIPVFRGDNLEWDVRPGDVMPPELESATSAARALGVEPRCEMTMGRPETAIVRAAERDGADLIVLRSRRLRGVAGVVLGSVSRHVVERARCSVLVARFS